MDPTQKYRFFENLSADDIINSVPESDWKSVPHGNSQRKHIEYDAKEEGYWKHYIAMKDQAGRIKAFCKVEQQADRVLYLDRFQSFEPGCGSLLLKHVLGSGTYDMLWLNADWSQDGTLIDYYRRHEFGFSEYVEKCDLGHEPKEIHHFVKFNGLSEKDVKRYLNIVPCVRGNELKEVAPNRGDTADDRPEEPTDRPLVVKETVSSVTDLDREYMEAVKNGDTEKCARMVREAAHRAMPDTRVVGKDGLPVGVYHGTKGKFFRFDPLKIGSNYGFDTAGYFFVDDETEDAIYHAMDAGGDTVMCCFISMCNPLIVNSSLFAFEHGATFEVDFEDRGINIPNNLWDRFHSEIEELRKRGGYDGIWIQSTYAETIEEARKQILRNFVIADENFLDLFMIPKGRENAIKSADPITYDYSRNVIPLSKRFDFASDDIREEVITESEHHVDDSPCTDRPLVVSDEDSVTESTHLDFITGFGRPLEVTEVVEQNH